MINLVLAVGSTVLMAAPVQPQSVDMTSFRNRLIESRTSLVKTFAQFSKAFAKITPEQKAQLMQNADQDCKNAFAMVIVGLPEVAKALDKTIESVGGEALTADEFRNIYDEEMNK